jgi:NADH-quinone oxidoreductase subunit C
MTDVVRLVDRGDWHAEALAAREDGCTFFDVLTVVDVGELEVVLRVWDPQTKRGLQLHTSCPSDDARVPTLTDVYAGAAWHERAAAELFGVVFEGHATAPLLLAPTFEGHPLRKDFVLAARVAKAWPGAKDPGESDADLAGPRRRRLQPPGVPSGWGQA